MTKLNSKTIGDRAENAAAAWLVKQGFLVIERNWKVPKVCEIDIIALKDGILFFVEVKFRINNLYGDGLEYIDAKKLAQMELAAENFLELNEVYQNYDWRLAGLSLSGPNPQVEEFVEL